MINAGREMWPICGRDDELRAITSWFHEPSVGGVILVGDAGVGKSSVAAAAAEHLGAAHVVRVAGNPALAGVPFGALAHVVPADAVDVSGEIDRAGVIRAMAAPDGRAVIVADDPEDLDEGSLGLIAQVVGSGSGFLVATARSRSAIPASLVGLERSNGVRRLTIEPLGGDTMELVLRQALDGAVSPDTARQLAAASAGNPLYLRELVEHAVSTGALAYDDLGEWRLAGRLGPSRRLSDLIADRIGGLDEGLREAAKLVAIGAPLRWSALEAGGFGEATLELERLGVVTVHDDLDPVIEIAHPMQAELLRADVRVLERRRLLTTLIDWFDTDGSSIDDRLRAAEWQMSIGRTPDVRTLEEGAHRACSARDHVAAERFARAALEQRTSLTMAAILVDALMHGGRSAEADEVAENHLASDQGDDPRARSRLVGLRVFNNLWYRELPDDAQAVVAAERRAGLDPISADELLIHEAYVVLSRDTPQVVLELIEGRDWTAEVAPQGLLLTAQMMADVGRSVDGLSTIEAAAAATRHHAAMTLSSPGSIDAARVRLAMLAGEFDRAESLIAELADRPEYRSDPFIRGYLSLSTGRISLLRGRPHTARRAFSEGRRIAESNRVVAMACTAGLAVAAGYLGDAATSASLLPELESYGLARVVRPSIAAGTAWALVATGHPARARELLVAEATYSASRSERSDAASLVLDAARLGAAPLLRGLVAELSPHVDGLGRFACDAAEAFAGQSIDGLSSAEAAAAALGLDLVAAELATAAALVHRRDDDPRASARARTRASGHLTFCESASTPGLVFADAVTPLSTREREIAALAVAGLSNQEIAERLYVSVRTVGNHLQNVYTKLGISGRAQLADVLTAIA